MKYQALHQLVSSSIQSNKGRFTKIFIAIGISMVDKNDSKELNKDRMQ